jgi:parallel beta-helix repeat protein
MNIRNIIAVLACVFLLFGTWFMSFSLSNPNVRLSNTAVASTRPIYVDGSGSNTIQNGDSSYPYHKIQDAIDIASAGDTVFVRRFHYLDTVVISHSNLNLVGEDRDHTIIDGYYNQTSDTVVDIQSVSNVRISKFTIMEAQRESSYGVHVEESCDQVEISGNNITRNALGIKIEPNSRNITITGNDISPKQEGIYSYNDAYVNISDNIIRGLGRNYPNYAGIHDISCSSTTIINNTISDIWFGIRTRYTDRTHVIGNIETNVMKGLEMTNCYNSTVEDNIMNGTGSGDECVGIVVGRDSLYQPLMSNTLSNNTVEGFWHGMDLTNTPSNTGYETNNTFVGNEFRNCTCGVYVDYNLSSNYIYHNNFLNNKVQAVDKGSNNWTSYPCGGNYWSDYLSVCNGTDNCWGEDHDKPGKDMIGDTPYNSSSGNVFDRYPLMYAWPMPNFWCFEDFSVAAITSSRITNFGFDNNTGISFNVNATGTNDSCIMIIPKSLLDGAFNFLVEDGSAVCHFDWSPQCHMINFTYGPGSHYVTITAEFVNKGTLGQLSKLGDLNGDHWVSLADLTTLAQHWHWIENSTYLGLGPQG